MSNPFQVVRDFEAALCEYTGAPYAVTTTSCTAALMLAVAWHIRNNPATHGNWQYPKSAIEIPKRTYVGVPMSIIHAGGRPTFREEWWSGAYQLKPLPIWDSARYFTGGLYKGTWNHGTVENGKLPSGKDYQINITETRDLAGQMVCVSFHWSKTLGIQQGGAILHDDPEADRWLRMARFDGRQEGMHPKDQKDWILGHHCYMAPETAAAGLVRLANLPRHNEPLPWGPGTDSDYPDLSQMSIFQ